LFRCFQRKRKQETIFFSFFENALPTSFFFVIVLRLYFLSIRGAAKGRKRKKKRDRSVVIDQHGKTIRYSCEEDRVLLSLRTENEGKNERIFSCVVLETDPSLVFVLLVLLLTSVVFLGSSINNRNRVKKKKKALLEFCGRDLPREKKKRRKTDLV